MIGSLPIPAKADEIVILTRQEYDALMDELEDARAAAAALAEGAPAAEMLLTAEEAEAAAQARSLIDFWIEKRAAKAADIAKAADLSDSQLSDIRHGTPIASHRPRAWRADRCADCLTSPRPLFRLAPPP